MKKKILVLTSFGGGGNLVASQAIESYLQEDYDIQLCYAFKEILRPLDPVPYITFHKWTSEDLYNIFVPGKYFKLLGWIYRLGSWYIQLQKESIQELLRTYFISNKPDLIISVIPVINNIILDIAQELNIPFILIPTDLDIKPYIINIINPTYKQFYIGLPFNDFDIIKPLKANHISNEYIHIIGSPLRKNFLIPKDSHYLRKKYGIPPHMPVIMVLMGSHGSNEIENYTKQLLTIKKPFHLFICIGKNERSKENLVTIPLPPHISMTIVSFTKNIADYMALSDIFLTKSGTLSICEALYMNLPLFLDSTSTILVWEQFNHFFIKKYDVGQSITTYQEINPLITYFLDNPNALKKYKKNIQKLEKKDCAHELKVFIKKILQE